MLQKLKSFFFTNQTMRQTIAKNVFWLSISNVGGRLLRAVIIIYAARILGASEWGMFSYAVSLVAFFGVLTDVGISPILIRETAKLQEKPEERARFLSASFALKSVFLAVSALIILFAVPLLGIEEGIKMILPIAVAIMIFDTFRELGSSLVRAIERTELEAALYLLTNAAIVVFGFLFLYASPSVTAFAYAYAIGTGIGMVATFFTLRKYFSGIFKKFSWRILKYILFSGWPFAISAILAALMIDTDILILGWLRSSEEVGFYSAAHRIIQLLYLLPAILSTSLLPAFSRLAGKSDEKLRAGLERTLGLVYLVAIPMSIGGVILGKEIIHLIFGQEYLAAAAPFQILMAALLVNFPAVILTSAIFTYNKQTQIMRYAAIGGLLNVGLDFIFIPRFGMTGSAIVTVIAQLVANIYLWRAMRKTNYFTVLPHIKKVALASVIMAAFTFTIGILGIPLLPNIGLSIIFYLAILYFLKEPLLKEFKLILRSAA